MYACMYDFCMYLRMQIFMSINLCMFVVMYLWTHICVKVFPRMTMIFTRYKSVSISVKSREHQKRTQSLCWAFQLLSELGDFVFCVQLGSIEKIVAWTGPYRTGLNVMQVCVFVYACMYVRMFLCMYLRRQICMYKILQLFNLIIKIF